MMTNLIWHHDKNDKRADSTSPFEVESAYMKQTGRTMKLNSHELQSHLEKNLNAIYLVSGEDWLLKQEALTAIRKTAKKSGFLEHVRLTPQNAEDWEALYATFHTTSFFNEKKIIDINLRMSLPTKSADEWLKDYAENGNKDQIILIEMEQLSDKIKKSAWFKAFDKVGIHIPIWPLSHEQFPLWLKNRARNYHLTFEPKAFALLLEWVEGNLAAGLQALEKLYLLKNDSAITETLILDALMDESRFSIFDLLSPLIKGDSKRALTILSHLQEEGTEPILIIWSLAKEFRLLAEFLNAKKTDLDVLFTKHRIFSRKKSLILNFIALYKTGDCELFLKKLYDLDCEVKGAKPGEIWRSLQLFCLNIISCRR